AQTLYVDEDWSLTLAPFLDIYNAHPVATS
ncbi:MAG: hypothetical protein QOE23_3890, partial [Pseudonocardiales bacterium]|nr:hypothetical protein [Pseudonocardiales bacterium]